MSIKDKIINCLFKTNKFCGRVNLVGPRASGKHTYLTMLSYYLSKNLDNSNISIKFINDDAKRLKEKAQYICLQGEQLEITPIQLDNLYPDYISSIFIKNNYFNKVCLDVALRNIPGEIFENKSFIDRDWYSNAIDMIASPEDASLLIIDVSSYREDSQHAEHLESYLVNIKERRELYSIDKTIKRIAFTLSKCELPDVWNNRHNSDKLVGQRFPKTKQVLDRWAATGEVEPRYFTSSAFGCYGVNNSEPNSLILKRYDSGISAVLKEAASWRPYGLISPIYWLCTGESLKGLDCY